MTLPKLLAMFALAFLATRAPAAGLATLDIPADTRGPALRGTVWFPCATSGPDCAIEGSKLPVVVISHGTGGSSRGHRDTAEMLADAGFLVAAVTHPGDNFQDLSRQGHLSAFATRPVDLRRLVDHLLGAWPEHARLDPARIGVFGFSRGGYTALVAVGARPDFTAHADLCPAGSPVPLCAEIARGEMPSLPDRDARIRAAVIADPLNVFAAAGLRDVVVPIQLWSSESGGDGVVPSNVAALRDALPTPPEWHLATGSGHFAFLAPCPPDMARELPAICVDAGGFDRVAFHRAFNADVLAFFRRTLDVR